MNKLDLNEVIKDSTIKNSPYFDLVTKDAYKENLPSINGKKLTCCKYCGEAHTTLYKIENGYICKDCKFLGMNEDKEEG